MENFNFKLLFKRVGAYLIDIMIVTIIASLVTMIPIFNRNNDKYTDLHKDYNVVFDEYTKFNTLLNNSYKDKKIESDEYEEIVAYEDYKDLVTEYYDDEDIDSDEFEKIQKSVNNEYLEKTEDYTYKFNKLGVSSSIVTLVCMFLYFGIFQFFVHGKTAGKLVFRISVVSIDDSKLNIFRMAIRSLIVNNIFLNVVGVVFLISSSKNMYLKASNTIDLLMSLVEAVIIFLIISREDGRGLHDLVCKTKVVVDNKKDKNVIDMK